MNFYIRELTREMEYFRVTVGYRSDLNFPVKEYTEMLTSLFRTLVLKKKLSIFFYGLLSLKLLTTLFLSLLE